MVDIIRNFGGELYIDGGSVTAIPSQLHGSTVDAADVPDLVPVVSVLAACAEGRRIYIMLPVCGSRRATVWQRYKILCQLWVLTLRKLQTDLSFMEEDLQAVV